MCAGTVEKGMRMLTFDNNVLAQVQVLDRVTQGMNVQLSLEMPSKGLSIEHVRRKVGKAFRVGHSEVTRQVQGTLSAAVCYQEEKGKKEWSDKMHKVLATVA
jgi:hypothetical protein